MGDIADMMLDGTLCQGCGCFLGADTDYPVSCSDCKKEAKRDAHNSILTTYQQIKKVSCPTCKKRVKAVGLNDHIRDAHGDK